MAEQSMRERVARALRDTFYPGEGWCMEGTAWLTRADAILPLIEEAKAEAWAEGLRAEERDRADMYRQGYEAGVTAEAARIEPFRKQWEEVISADGFEAAVEVYARQYHDSACEYEARLANLLCELTDGRMSGTGYDVPTMVREVEAAFERDAQEAVTAERERCAGVFDNIPIIEGASDREPWVKLNLIDFTKAIGVISGTENPDEWVSVPCERKFEHAPHHWSEYRANEEPLRVPHFCDGTIRGAREPEPATEEGSNRG